LQAVDSSGVCGINTAAVQTHMLRPAYRQRTTVVFVEIMFPYFEALLQSASRKEGTAIPVEIRLPNLNIPIGRLEVFMWCFGNITGINTAAV